MASRAARRGFTLIEVLVALFIVAVALMAAMRAVGSVTLTEDALHARLLAQLSADNVAARLRAEQTWPDPGTRRFDCPQAELALVCREDVGGTPNPLIRRVEIDVFAPGEHGDRLAHLVLTAPDVRNAF